MNSRFFSVLTGILSACGPAFTTADPLSSSLTLDANAPGEEGASTGGEAGKPDAGGGSRDTTEGGSGLEAGGDASAHPRRDAEAGAADAPELTDAGASPEAATVVVHCSWGPILSCPACNSSSLGPCCLGTGACGCGFPGFNGAVSCQ